MTDCDEQTVTNQLQSAPCRLGAGGNRACYRVHRKQNTRFWLMLRSKTVEHPGGQRRWFGPWRFV